MFQISKFSVLVAAISLVAADTLYAQNYNITPNDSVVAVAPFNDFNHFTIQENNLTTNALIFSWQQVLLSVPAGWTANLCDAGHCYTGFPVTGTMDTVFNGDFGLMSIGVDPGTILGTAFIQYVVWEESTPLQKDTLTWIITANGSTGINDIGAKTQWLRPPDISLRLHL